MVNDAKHYGLGIIYEVDGDISILISVARYRPDGLAFYFSCELSDADLTSDRFDPARCTTVMSTEEAKQNIDSTFDLWWETKAAVISEASGNN